MKANILVVEDERKISDLICKYLALEEMSYIQVYDGASALEAFVDFKPDLVILDIMIPEIDGLHCLDKIRAKASTPVIMLTARIDEVDRLIGFSKGADDYVCKPFNAQELVARVKAVLRRSGVPDSKNVLSIGDVSLVFSEHCVKVKEQEIALTQIEFGVLATLMKSPHQVFSREELLVAAQGKYSESYERTIDFHIKNLRKKLNKNTDQDYIKTVYGIGYKFGTY